MATPLLSLLKSSPPAKTTKLDSFLENYAASAHLGLDPIENAFLNSFGCDRAGFAFLFGYQAALHKLCPQLSKDTLAALCATEAGGGHPRAIETQLSSAGDNYLLNGQKSYVTLGAHAQQLLIIARAPEQNQDRPMLKAVLIPASRSGIEVQETAPTPFVPEVAHGTLILKDVELSVSEVLPDDGYLNYLKAFRTIEDIHVFGAILSLVTARILNEVQSWPSSLVPQLIATIEGLRRLSEQPSLAAETHLQLAGHLEQVRGLLKLFETHYPDAEDSWLRRWQRDALLLKVAGSARKKRAEKAYAQLLGEPKRL